MLPWLLCLALLAAVIALWVKTWLFRRDMDRLAQDLEEILSTDTNMLLSLSTRDRRARRLASELNRHLRLLRAQRRRYLDGDRELKEAVTNVSHDLRTPLTAIRGYLDLLEREALSPSAARYAAIIRGRAEDMTRMTEELFRFSLVLSEEEPAWEELDLRSAVEEALAGFYPALTGRGIVPEVSLPASPVVRRLDRRAVRRVLDNLLGNAVKYSDGDLSVCLSAGGELRLVNRASGLDEVAVGRLFDRFFTVEAPRGGSTGVGLAVARHLVEKLGGSVAASYEDGRLCVTVSFL